mgnify:CR=1 FL=1|tara:strand:+ start:233 stop:502 length:270 start_codon:yes stop_codon:yes gene_type:complete
MKKSKDKIDEKILKDIESKLSLKKGLKEEDLLEDIDKILEYANSLSSLNIENIHDNDLNKMDKELSSFKKSMEIKYKDFLPKDNLDSKK